MACIYRELARLVHPLELQIHRRKVVAYDQVAALCDPDCDTHRVLLEAGEVAVPQNYKVDVARHL